VTLWVIDAAGNSVARAADVPAVPSDWPQIVGLRSDASSLMIGPAGGVVATVPLGYLVPREVRIGGERIEWHESAEPTLPAAWPSLQAERRWEPGDENREGAQDTLEVRVRNGGGGPALQVRALFSAQPPELLPGGPSVLHLGTVLPGSEIVRTLRLSPVPGRDRRELEFSLRFSDARGFAPPPLRWIQMPRCARDAEGYARLAGAVFAAARETLKEWLGDPTFNPKLQPLPTDAYGFVCSADAEGSVIKYQNIYTLDAAGLDVNRRILHAESAEDLMRGAELMLYVYIPHELVHAARRHLKIHRDDGWPEEFAANTVQPLLTEAVVARIPQCPYGPDSFRRAWERLTAGLTVRVPEELIRQVGAYLEAGGERNDFGMEAWHMFQCDPVAYVYVGARVSLRALDPPVPLESLKARFLRK
jgi:hypothetical protein